MCTWCQIQTGKETFQNGKLKTDSSNDLQRVFGLFSGWGSWGISRGFWPRRGVVMETSALEPASTSLHEQEGPHSCKSSLIIRTRIPGCSGFPATVERLLDYKHTSLDEILQPKAHPRSDNIKRHTGWESRDEEKPRSQGSTYRNSAICLGEEGFPWGRGDHSPLGGGPSCVLHPRPSETTHRWTGTGHRVSRVWRMWILKQGHQSQGPWWANASQETWLWAPEKSASFCRWPGNIAQKVSEKQGGDQDSHSENKECIAIKGGEKVWRGVPDSWLIKMLLRHFTSLITVFNF